MGLPNGLLDRLAAAVGPRGLITDADPDALAPYLAEQRGRARGAARVVVRPSAAAAVAEVVRLCADAGVAVVPQGGNTGLVGGSVADERQVLLSLGRMTRIRSLDPVNYCMAVDAGCVLADIQAAAADAGCLFPLSLAAEGSCQIGGNLSSNAGGLNVLRYGPARDLCLGLEVVLPDGRLWDGMRMLGKDNTGYALKHLFIGGEGTLGVITGAVLKLFPAARETATALCALPAVEPALALLSLARARSGDLITAFELIPRFALEIACRHGSGCRDPLADPAPWYVLIEGTSSRPDSGLPALFESILAEAFEAGILSDAVVAATGAQAEALWRLRETIPEAQKREGASIKHDISVPVSRIPDFLSRATAAVEAALPGVRPCPFGHVGDGNLHFNLTQPIAADPAAFLARWPEINALVHDIVLDLDGSISAEHGIGRFKTEELHRAKSRVEMDLMRAVKTALDPRNLMNPGVLFGPDGGQAGGG